MAYKKFKNNDIFYNTLETHPECNFAIYNGSIYLNSKGQITGAYALNVGGVDTGYTSLYELNVDRSGSGGPDLPISSSYIHPYMIKGGFRNSFKTITSKQFNQIDYGTIMTGSLVGDTSLYPMSASIVREHHTSSTRSGANLHQDGRFHLNALENTLNHYVPMNPHYAFSGALGNKNVDAVTLISIPSIFYGSKIKKGSVTLDFFVSGTLIGQLKDENQDGSLIQTAPSSSANSGSIAGVVLYNEGFMILTGNWSFSEAAQFPGEGYDNRIGSGQPATLPGKLTPKWIYFGAGANDHVPVGHVISSSFGLSFKGTNDIQTITMLAHAEKGKLNHSSNPTYKLHGQDTTPKTGSFGYMENSNIVIKNVASSSYADPTGSFQKTTYISSIGIYDEDKNLIGVAKVATPVKKTENREFTFKLKLDI